MTAKPALQQILYPPPKEEFFRHSRKKKNQEPAQDCRPDTDPISVWMNESESNAQPDYNRREEKKFAQSCFPVAPAQAKIETDAVELADGKKSLEACVDQK